jgi:cobalamin biosynthesis protein CobT
MPGDDDMDILMEDPLAVLLGLLRVGRRFHGSDDSNSDSEEEGHEYDDSPESDERSSEPGRELSESAELEQAIAASLAAQENHELSEVEMFERARKESEREEDERKKVLDYISDPRRLKSVLSGMKGVDHRDPCFNEFRS